MVGVTLKVEPNPDATDGKVSQDANQPVLNDTSSPTHFSNDHHSDRRCSINQNLDKEGGHNIQISKMTNLMPQDTLNPSEDLWTEAPHEPSITKQNAFNQSTKNKDSSDEESTVAKPNKTDQSSHKEGSSLSSLRRFPCPHCPLVLTTRPNHRKHMMIHTGERPFVCTVCGLGKITRNELNRHMLTHSRDREHFCGLCGNAFFCCNSVRRHIRQIHQMEPQHAMYCRITRFTDEANGGKMVKIKFVKDGKTYNKIFKELDS